jgi:hypothetical protein
MLNVLMSQRWGSSWIWLGAIGCLGGALILLAPVPTMAQNSSRKTRSPGAEKPESPKAKAAASDDDQAPAPAPDTATTSDADPSQTRKIMPIEIFKDPAIEELQLLDLKKFKPILAPFPTENEILLVKDMAGNINVSVEVPLIDRVVRGLAAKLTDPKGIKALIEPPPELVIPENANKAARKKAEREMATKMEANAEAAKEIPKATANLLEPLFRARASGNQPFLKAYEKSLKENLPSLLNNHLIPRVQAMIVLGEAGSLDALEIYKNQIRLPNQTLWVKLWALEGLTKIKEHGGVMTTDDESRAAKVISDLLDKNEDLPWPLQLRGLEALAALRQGFLPTAASKVHMASTAMHFLANSEAKVEVRAEASRALGMMQIGNSVPKFNFSLVAHSTGLLAADLAAEINALYFEGSGTGKGAKPPLEENRTKAQYLAALLIGPVYQCFDGLPSQRESGLLRMAPTNSRADIQKTFTLIKEISQSVVHLMGSAPKQYKDRKKTLSSQIAALRKFLEEHRPASRRLVPDGDPFPGGEAAGAGLVAPAQPLAGFPRGR